MSSSTNYGPVGETPSELLLEKTFLISGYLTGVGFGLQFALWWLVVALLRKRKSGQRLASIAIPYLTVLCVMNLIWTATSAYGLQLTFIENRNYPEGGVLAFLGVEFALPANIVSLSSYIAGNLLADAVMIWRYAVVLRTVQSMFVKVSLVIPMLMWLGSLIMAIMFSIQTTGPPGLFAKITASFGIPYFCLSMSLNIIMTLLITWRISAYRVTHANRSTTSTVKTIFIESSFMYSVVSFLLMVTFALGHPISQIWLGIAPAVQNIGVFLIFIRIAKGKAFESQDETLRMNAQEESSLSGSDTKQAL